MSDVLESALGSSFNLSSDLSSVNCSSSIHSPNVLIGLVSVSSLDVSSLVTSPIVNGNGLSFGTKDIVPSLCWYTTYWSISIFSLSSVSISYSISLNLACALFRILWLL